VLGAYLPTKRGLGNTGVMGFYGDQVVPRFIDLGMSRGEFTPIRARVAAGLDGDVIEVGFGSGVNVPHYPDAVNRVQAVDPASVGRKLAAKRVAGSSVDKRTGGCPPRRMLAISDHLAVSRADQYPTAAVFAKAAIAATSLNDSWSPTSLLCSTNRVSSSASMPLTSSSEISASTPDVKELSAIMM
jgi:hypothetical protein